MGSNALSSLTPSTPIWPNSPQETSLSLNFLADHSPAQVTCTDSYSRTVPTVVHARPGVRVCGIHAPVLMFGQSSGVSGSDTESYSQNSSPLIANLQLGLNFAIEGLSLTLGAQYEQGDTRGIVRRTGGFALLEHNEASRSFPGRFFSHTFGAGLGVGSVTLQTPSSRIEGPALSFILYRDWWNVSFPLQGLQATLGVRRSWNTTFVWGSDVGQAHPGFREFLAHPETSWVGVYLNVDWESTVPPQAQTPVTRGQAVSTIAYYLLRQLSSVVSAPESAERNQEFLQASPDQRLGVGLRTFAYSLLDGYEFAAQSQDLSRLSRDADYRGGVHRALGVVTAFRTIDFFTRTTPGAVTQLIPSGVQWLSTALRMESALAGRRPHAAPNADWLRRVPVRVGLIVAGALCAGGLAYAQSQLNMSETELELLSGGANGCMQLGMLGVSP